MGVGEEVFELRGLNWEKLYGEVDANGDVGGVGWGREDGRELDDSWGLGGCWLGWGWQGGLGTLWRNCFQVVLLGVVTLHF